MPYNGPAPKEGKPTASSPPPPPRRFSPLVERTYGLDREPKTACEAEQGSQLPGYIAGLLTGWLIFGG